MKYLLDTNIVSELRKQNVNPEVLKWYEQNKKADFYLSVITLGEIRKGIELIRLRDKTAAINLDEWLEGLYRIYTKKIIPINNAIAERWGRLNSPNPRSFNDSYIAATALENNMTLVTRNISDMKGLGVNLLNPFLT